MIKDIIENNNNKTINEDKISNLKQIIPNCFDKDGRLDLELLKKEFNKVMLVSTGALLSPTSTLQKQTIPCVAHAVVIEND